MDPQVPVGGEEALVQVEQLVVVLHQQLQTLLGPAGGPHSLGTDIIGTIITIINIIIITIIIVITNSTVIITTMIIITATLIHIIKWPSLNS